METVSTAPKPWWQDHPVLLQAAGLSPILAVSSLAVNGMVLGLLTLLVCTAACGTAPLLRRLTDDSWRLPAHMITIALYTTLAMVVLLAGFYPLYRQLGIYVPLICCNTAILFTMETRTGGQTVRQALQTGLVTGAGFLLIIVGVAVVRELFTYGSFFADAHLLLPTFAASDPTGGSSTRFPWFRFSLLQPGAFILLGLLLALKNHLLSHLPRER
ncbi:MAG: Electron transport complex protein rnfE [Pseudomonadota bacterium]|jgi:electron transport complex protein RnfE